MEADSSFFVAQKCESMGIPVDVSSAQAIQQSIREYQQAAGPAKVGNVLHSTIS